MPLIIEIISAVGVITCGVLAWWSSSKTNKSLKEIENLKNGSKVKEIIAEKRHKAYEEIIEYINSWSDVKRMHNFASLRCKSSFTYENNIFEHRIKTPQDLIAEYDKVRKMEQNFFYYDKDTYFELCCITTFLKDAITISEEMRYKDAKFDKFAFIIYNDLHKLLIRISKPVNNYVKSKNPLDYEPTESIDNKAVEEVLSNLDYMNIYVNSELNNKLEIETEKMYPDVIQRAEAELINLKLIYKNNRLDKATRDKAKEDYENINQRLKNVKRKSSNKPIKNNDMYKAWQECMTCGRRDCPLNRNDKNAGMHYKKNS